MPEYLAPGVYVEEVSYRSKTIDGVETSTAGFVGTTSIGPSNEPFLVKSIAEFEETFGADGDVARAARAFFAEGGRRLFVQRVEGADDYERGLRALERIREIAIVAAPGADVAEALVDHATRCNRFAIVDSAGGQSVDDVLALRQRIDSSYAALYYPRVSAAGAVGVPSSGSVAGLYARVDAEQGVWKAPAGEALTDAIGVERTLTEREIERLVAGGVNPIRVLPSGDVLVWGARTASTDPDWKYVNVRRYLTYLEHSIDRGTQWTVFEPNAEPLWTAMRETISSFLADQFRAGALAGRTANEAYFVRCDQSTMTQGDVDGGVLVCVVGVAPVRPAEFIVIRIGRWTADHRP